MRYSELQTLSEDIEKRLAFEIGQMMLEHKMDGTPDLCKVASVLKELRQLLAYCEENKDDQFVQYFPTARLQKLRSAAVDIFFAATGA